METSQIIRDLEKSLINNPKDIINWLSYIEVLNHSKYFDEKYTKLIESHEISTKGHAINVFSSDIIKKCGEKLVNLSISPKDNIKDVIDELVKWKTAIQCAHSHDVSKGYFIDAEPYMEMQWNNIIWPIIKDLDFTTVLDLACGHGRNSEYLRRYTKDLYLVDINKSCIDSCFERFGNIKDGTKIHYHVTDGNNLKMINDSCLTLVYSWDSMVHFDKLIVFDYLKEIKRILKPGGCAFLHYSNIGEKNPDSNWANNPGTRSDMSGSLMIEYSKILNMDIIYQKIQGLAEGWGEDGMDCVSIIKKI